MDQYRHGRVRFHKLQADKYPAREILMHSDLYDPAQPPCRVGTIAGQARNLVGRLITTSG